MKKKQIVGIVVAGAVFILVCSLGVLLNYITEKNLQKSKLNLTSFVKEDTFDYSGMPLGSYVGLVRVEGTIMDTDDTGLFGTTTPTYQHKKTLHYIEKMSKDDNNKGILLYLDSPGGGVYESDELYLKLMQYKEETGRPIWSYMANQACSGAYYIAMASDKVVGNRNGITGSIGVIYQLTNLKGLYEKIGIEEINVKSAKNKAMGSAGEEFTQEQRDILQSIVDEAYEQFVGIVSQGRTMMVDKVKELADGRIYTMQQAVENDLVDATGDYDETVNEFLNDRNAGTLYEPSQTTNLWSSMFSYINEVKPKSETELLTGYLERKGNGVLMYYAEP